MATKTSLYSKKIDREGNYVHFSGYTIVAHAIHPLPQPLIDMVTYLSNSELRQYYSFLPRESYHVTINPLQNVSDEDRTLLHNAQNKLIKEKTSLVCTVERLRCTGVILIEVSFDEKNDEFINALRRVRSDELKRADILPTYKHSWHLTLAYQYKDIETQEIQNRLHSFVTQFPVSARARFAIALDHIRICHYNDMTRFTPI